MPDTGLPASAALPNPASAWISEGMAAGFGADLALLCSALLLQRFSWSFGHAVFELALVPAVFVLLREFAVGHLQIDYDRVLWLLALIFVTACSALMNFQARMLSSYGLFVVLYSLFTLRRSSTAFGFRRTLYGFQGIAAILSAVAVVQFVAQFMLDGRKLIDFYGVFPKFLFTDQWNTVIPISFGSSLIKSNGLFLAEPSILSQIAGLAIIIETLEFRRPRYLIILSLGLLMSYSGTGLLLVLAFLPFAGIRHKNALLAALAVIVLGVALLASGVIDASAFSTRIDEFQNTQASGFARFVSPFWLAKQNFETASLPQLLFGHGPGTAETYTTDVWYTGFSSTWLKLFYEYGLIGSTIFVGFLASCLKNSTCPAVVLASVLIAYVFLGGQLLGVSFLVLMMVLCTLSQFARRENRTEKDLSASPIGGSAGI